MKKTARSILWALFGFYCLGLLYLYFVNKHSSNFSLADHLKNRTNLVPFKTISGYVTNAADNSMNLDIIIKNLFGKLLVFLPMGLFLPCLFKKTRSFISVLVVTFSIILSINLLQVFLTIGSFDIDDFILNLIGCSLGYLLLKIGFVNKSLKQIDLIQ